jgi:hypothetical protein
MTNDVRTLILGHITEIIGFQAGFESHDECETFYDGRDGAVELRVWKDHTASVVFHKENGDFIERDFTAFEDAKKAFEVAWNVRNDLREALGKFFR